MRNDKSSPLLHAFEVFKDTSESGQGVLIDELVYVDKVSNFDMDAFRIVPKGDGYPYRWIELNLVLHADRETPYRAVICLHSQDGRTGRSKDSDVKPNPLERNSSVLVDIPQSLKLPELGGFVSSPAMVRLKSVNDVDTFLREPLGCPVELTPTVGVGDAYDGEARFFEVGGAQSAKLIGNVVQGGSQAGDEVSDNESHVWSWSGDTELRKAISSFKIVVSDQFIGLATGVDFDSLVKSVEVCLRPTHLQASRQNTGLRIYIDFDIHDRHRN